MNESSTPPEKPTLRLRKTGDTPSAPPEAPPAEDAKPSSPEKKKAQSASKSSESKKASSKPTKSKGLSFRTELILAWILFAGLGTLSYFIRYQDLFDIVELMQTYGPYVLVGFHFVVVLFAFSEDLFTGFLCLILPGYSLYYMFFQMAQPIFVGVVMGLAVGSGEDTYYFLAEVWQSLSAWAKEFVQGDS